VKKIIYCTIFLLLTLSFILPNPSYAGNTGISGFDAMTLKLPSDGSGTFSISGSRSLKQGQPHFGLNANYAYHLIKLSINNRNQWIVNYLLGGNIDAAVGLFDFLSLGVDIPYAFLENLKNINTLTSYKEVSFGDIRLDVKGQILEDKSWHPGIAIIPSVFFPTGNTRRFTGNMGYRYQGLLVLDKTIGPVYISINGGYRFLKKKTIITRIINDQILYGLGLAVHLPVWNKSLAIIAEANGASVVRNFSKNTTSIEAIGGLRKTFKNGLRIDVAGGGGIVKSLGTPAYRIMAGLAYTRPMEEKVEPKALHINETVYFKSDGQGVATKYMDTLRGVGENLSADKSAGVLVTGYTDSRGRKAYNEKLSLERANTVEKHLFYFGADENQVEATGMGPTNFIAPNNTREDRAQNRRVTIESR